VLEAAVDSPARPVGAAVSDPAAYGVYPLIILIVYDIVTGGILCSDHCGNSPTTMRARPIPRTRDIMARINMEFGFKRFGWKSLCSM